MWNEKLINPLKINKFDSEGTNSIKAFKCKMIIHKHFDELVVEGVFKTKQDAEYQLQTKLRKLKEEKYPYEDNKDLTWRFTLEQVS